MKKLTSLTILFILIISYAEAQFKYDSLYQSEIKTVEIVHKIIKNDCPENKILFEPYLPEDDNKNLFHSITNAIETRELTAYSLDFDYNIGNQCVLSEIYEKFNGISDFTKYNSKNITFIVKEANFYNHNDFLIQTQTIGISPLLSDKETFFVYYKDIKNSFEENKQQQNFIKILFEQNYNAKVKEKYISNGNSDDWNFEKGVYNNIIYDIPKNIEIKEQKILDLSQISYIKIVYRQIWKDTLENYYLFYPETKEYGYNLVDIIFFGIHYQGLTPYEARPSDVAEEFDIIATEDEVYKKMGVESSWEIIEGDSVLVEKPINSENIYKKSSY